MTISIKSENMDKQLYIYSNVNYFNYNETNNVIVFTFNECSETQVITNVKEVKVLVY